MKRFAFDTLVALLATLMAIPSVVAAEPDTEPLLSHTRLLRRVLLTLEGRPPTVDEYQAILDAADDAARDALIDAQIDTSLASDAFYEQMVEFGYDFLAVGNYGHGITMNNAIRLSPCPEGTAHAGKLGTFSSYPALGDPEEICDDAAAMTHTVEPWWAPGTTVETIGWAGAGDVQVPDEDNPGEFLDCGVANRMMNAVMRRDNGDPDITPRCSCGPNLIWCARRAQSPGQGGGLDGRGYDGFPNDPTGQIRSLFEEPARLFAHLIINDKPFSDLVIGDYTVANQGLQHFYVRAARMNSAMGFLDQATWWQSITDPDVWREVKVEDMNPHFLSARNTTFDPRVDMGEPEGIPAAGVLTMIGSLGNFERERPRAARWLEVFTCRDFVPPPPEAEFEPFQRDPATEGVCQQCHTVIDPAAIHFKRFTGAGIEVGGMGPWHYDDYVSYSGERIRWEASYLPDTYMTPVTQAEIEANPDARFLDFLPAGSSLFGIQGDGTIGPLGFGKLLVNSGEFDRCVARKMYERFGGVKLDSGQHAKFIARLTEQFVSNDRNVKALIRYILERPPFRMGL